MPELIVQGRRVSYLDQGIGIPLVLLHAGGSSGKQWLKHSYGGATALRLALQRSDLLKALILIEPIVTPLLKLAGEHETFREYCDMTQAFLTSATAGRLEDAWRG